jgi:signal transduction histidine kinase
MARSTPIVIALALAALAAGAGIAVLELSSTHQDSRYVWAVFGPAVGWSFVFTGLYAARHRPESRIGALMVALGFAWFVFCLEASDSDLVYTFALLAGAVWGSVFLHIGITFPSGRIHSPTDRAIVLAGYLVFPLAFLPALLFTADSGPENLLLIRDDPDLSDALSLAGALVYLVLFVIVLVRGARRWLASTAFERVQLTPVYLFALSTFMLVTIARGLDSDEAWWAALISTGLMPFAFLGGLMRSEIASLDASLRESLEELRASRARIVEAADAERRRLERDLHDGAQSRLVALSLLLRVARKKADDEVAELLDRASDELSTSLAELRELARGIHPAVLTDRGLEPALRTLADRAPVPVEVRAEIPERLPGSVESAAYFVASEALTNVAKYSRATEARVVVERVNGHVTVEVSDDGVGGADAARGSGLRGLGDRVAALDGTLSVESPQGRGTRLRAEIPVVKPSLRGTS